MDKENDRKQMEGGLYNALFTDETAGEYFKSYDICHEFNSLDPEDEQGRKEILPRLFGSIGAGCRVHPPVRIFRGDLISLSDNVSIGAGTCILATNRVKIGSNTIIGDECSISCAGHPMDKDLRAQGLEYGWPIEIGSDVVLGMGTSVVPGVTIGDGAVIGAGSVVTKNIPAGVYADGNPCRVRRKLRTPEEEERLYGAKAAADADLSDPSEVLCLKMNQIALSDYGTRTEFLKGFIGSMGDDSMTMSPEYIRHADRLNMGIHSFINYDGHIDAAGGVEIRDHVLIAPNPMIDTVILPEDPELRRQGLRYTAKVTIEDGVWMGAGVRVLPGVTIGENSVIGAGSVVTHDIPAGCLAAGNPCEVRRKFTEEDFARYTPDPDVVKDMSELDREYARIIYHAIIEDIEVDRRIYYGLSDDYGSMLPSAYKERADVAAKIFPNAKGNIEVFGPIIVDQGYNVEADGYVFINHNFILLATNKVKFGKNVLIGPNCVMSCAGHPFNIEERRDDLEYAYPITIGDDVWIGEGCKILPGVTVGSGSVIAAGSVVAYDIPEGVLAAGQPARPVKRISGFKSEE